MFFNKRYAVLSAALIVGVPSFLGVLSTRAAQIPKQVLPLTKAIKGTKGTIPFNGSMWISPTSVLVLDRGGKGFSEVNTRTGQSTQRGLTGNEIPGNFGTCVSPDGKWVIWQSMTASHQPAWKLASIRSKRTSQFPRRAFAGAGVRVSWLPNSSGWVEAQNDMSDTNLRIYHVNSPKFRDIKVTSLSSLNNINVLKNGDFVLVGGFGLPQEFVRVTPSAKPKITNFSISCPVKLGSTTEIEISPRGDRILWDFQKSGGNSVTETLWFSTLDGKKFRQFVPPVDKYRLSLTYLHWTPDGKAVCGWNNYGLVKLPAP